MIGARLRLIGDRNIPDALEPVLPTILIEPLTAAAFAPFGQVIELAGAEHFAINNGMTERYHDLAKIELGGEQARPMISIFRGQS